MFINQIYSHIKAIFKLISEKRLCSEIYSTNKYYYIIYNDYRSIFIRRAKNTHVTNILFLESSLFFLSLSLFLPLYIENFFINFITNFIQLLFIYVIDQRFLENDNSSY